MFTWITWYILSADDLVVFCTLEPLMTAVKGSNAGVEALMTLPLVKRLEPAPHVVSSGRRFRFRWLDHGLARHKTKKQKHQGPLCLPIHHIFSGGSYDISYIYQWKADLY